MCFLYLRYIFSAYAKKINVLQRVYGIMRIQNSVSYLILALHSLRKRMYFVNISCHIKCKLSQTWTPICMSSIFAIRWKKSFEWSRIDVMMAYFLAFCFLHTGTEVDMTLLNRASCAAGWCKWNPPAQIKDTTFTYHHLRFLPENNVQNADKIFHVFGIIFCCAFIAYKDV